MGSTLAARLARDGHDVVLIEQSATRVGRLSEQLDAQVLSGNGASVETLRRAGIADCQTLFACTASDETNMVVSFVASAIFGVPQVVARLREPDSEHTFQTLVDTFSGDQVSVNPERAAVEKVLSLLPVPGAMDVSPFLDGRLLIAGFRVAPDSDFAGLLISHLRLLFPHTPVLVVAIRRGDHWRVPHGEDEIQAGDLVYFALDRDEMHNVLSLLGNRPTQERRVIVAGASRIGLLLAQRLEDQGVPVTLLDHRPDACISAAEALRHAMVVEGSPTDQQLLEEEGTDHTAAFVACTENHQSNLVSCLLARRLGAAHTFALVDDPALAPMVGELGIDAVISPRLLTVGLALQFFRRGRIRAAAALLEDHVEVVEVDLEAASPLTRGPLRELALPRGVLVAAVGYNGALLLPRGDAQLPVGGRAVLVSSSEHARDLDAFLGG